MANFMNASKSNNSLFAKGLTLVLFIIGLTTESKAQVASFEVCYGTVPPTMVTDSAITGGTGPFTYHWEESTDNASWVDALGNNDSISYVPTNPLTDTIYYRRYVVDQSCLDTAYSNTIAFEATSQLLVNVIPTAITCSDSVDGAIDLTVIGGGAPYTYNWSNSSTSQNITNLSPGTYAVTVTDASGCDVVDSVVVGDKDSIRLSFSVTNANCQGGDDGEIEVSSSGGNGGFGYAWSNGNTDSIAQNLIDGNTYAVTVTDSLGCFSTDSISIGFDNALPLVDLGSDTAYGIPSLIVLTTGIDGTYTWSTGATTDSISVILDSDTTIWVNVVDNNGCSNSDTITIQGLLSSAVLKSSNEIHLYPNPTNGLFNVRIEDLKSQDISIQVVDLKGRLVLSESFKTSNSLFTQEMDLSGQTPGVYFINLQFDGKQVTKKIQLL